MSTNKKCIILMVSRNFLVGHPRTGEATNFPELILQGIKKHTIRAGLEWKQKIDKVNAGTHYLSVRYWSGKPYQSSQVEITQFEKLGWQKVEILERGVFAIDDKTVMRYETVLKLAENDGLSYNDFKGWFKFPFQAFTGSIIHFTDFRY